MVKANPSEAKVDLSVKLHVFLLLKRLSFRVLSHEALESCWNQHNGLIIKLTRAS